MKNFLLLPGLFILNCFANQLTQDFLQKVETPTERRLNPLKERFEKMVENSWEQEIKKYKTPTGFKYAIAGVVVGSLLALTSFSVDDHEFVMGSGLVLMIPSGLYLGFHRERDRKESICAGKAHLYDFLNHDLKSKKDHIECDLKNEEKYGKLVDTQEGKEFLERMGSFIEKCKEELRSCQVD